MGFREIMTLDRCFGELASPKSADTRYGCYSQRALSRQRANDIYKEMN